MASSLPSDNRIADDNGRLMPAWRDVFQRLAPLADLNAKQINTLNSLAKAFTTPDENGDTLLNEDGDIVFPQQTFSTVLNALNSGSIVATQSTELDQSLSLNAVGGLRFGEKTSAGISVYGVDDSIVAPVSGGYLCPTGASYESTSLALNTANRIYASHFSVPRKIVVKSVGPICSGSGAFNSSLGIFSDSDMRPGRKIWSSSYTTITANTPLETSANLTLEAGNYWVLFQGVSLANLRISANAAVGGRLGFILASGVDLRPIIGIYRDPSSGGFLEDETTSVWSATFNGGVPFPFMVMGV